MRKEIPNDAHEVQEQYLQHCKELEETSNELSHDKQEELCACAHHARF